MRLWGCLMCRMCHIVPQDILLRYSRDPSLSAADRQAFAASAMIDAQFREIRTQATKLTYLAMTVMPAVGPVASAPAVEVYDCQNGQVLPGTLVVSPGQSADMTARNVFTQTKLVSTFYQKVFGRNSIDDAGMTMLSSVHYGTHYNNAFWNGTQMSYGDGDGQIFIDFSKGNDVICHELTHGVTQHSLQLRYANEPGGLNESISDCFGVMFRQWSLTETGGQLDWLIGSDILGPGARSRGFACLRDLSDPGAAHCLAPQPKHFGGYRPGMDPHESSGIPNFAFYHICQAVGGNSWDRVGQVWYKVLVGSGPKPSMRMKTFANRTRQVAGQLYSGDTAFIAAVDSGWKAVGL